MKPPPQLVPLTRGRSSPRKRGPSLDSRLRGNERSLWLVLSETHRLLIIVAVAVASSGFTEAVMFALRLTALALALLVSTAARADDVADFYRGKELRLII